MQVSLHQIFSTMLLASLLLTCTQRGEWTALSVSHYGNDVVLTTVEKKKKKHGDRFFSDGFVISQCGPMIQSQRRVVRE